MHILHILLHLKESRDFPGGSVVKTLYFQHKELRVIPGQGTKILHEVWYVQGKKKKKYIYIYIYIYTHIYIRV